MTTINSIIDMLVKTGLEVAEAWEMAEAEDIIAERAYIDYVAEEARDKRELEYWAEERFFEEQEREFFYAHIAGKSYDEIDPMDYSIWSDLYKDVNGIRPRWYMEQLRESERRQERKEVRDDLENDGWIMCETGFTYYPRQIDTDSFEWTIWLWDNHGRTFEALEEDME